MGFKRTTPKQDECIMPIKCITFDKSAQSALPEHIKAKMKADRDKSKIEKFCQNSCNLSADYCDKAKYDECADLRVFKSSL